MTVEKDTLLGTLDYGSVRVATATMGYKHRAIDTDVVRAAMLTPKVVHIRSPLVLCKILRFAN